MLSNLFARLGKVIRSRGVKTKTDPKPKKDARKSVSFIGLFRYATKTDMLLVIASIFFCLIKSMNMLLTIVAYTEVVSLLVDRIRGIGTTSKTIVLPYFEGGKILTNATKEENMAELQNDAWAFAVLLGSAAVVMLISGTLCVDLFNLAGLRIIVRLRRKFFRAAIRQDIGWHDMSDKQNFALLMTDNMETVRDGISENFAHFMHHSLTMATAFLISLIYAWKLTLIISIYIPIIVGSKFGVAKNQIKLTLREQDAYGNSGSLVEEIIGAIRTVVAFAGEKLAIKRYEELLIPAKRAGNRKGYFLGFSEGITKFMKFLASAIIFWYGTHLIVADRGNPNPEYTPAVVVMVLIGVFVGVDHLYEAISSMDNVTAAMGAVVPIYEVIEASSKIDPMSSEGKIPDYDAKGEIEFKDVFFKYPNREDAIVLRGLSLTVKAGEAIALVGHTGCGKSTCLQLVQRFYDPAFGNVLLDGLDLRHYNVSWLRSQISIVGQEPVLFHGTIVENIKHGYPEASEKEVECAARAAGAHDFITQLPEGYNTLLNENNVQLSGGQKQRIAIARALVKNPRILLLDEATSALDLNSEKVVQTALAKVSKGRTTIVVSHRFSAIRDADRIAFIHEGKVAEVGTHDQLMKLRGKYYAMVAAHESHNDDSDADNLDKGISNEELNNQMNFNRFEKNRFSSASIKVNNFCKDPDKGNESDGNRDQFFKTFIRIIKSCKKQRTYLIFAILSAAVFGIAQPLFAIIFAKFNEILTEHDDDIILHQAAVISIISLVIAVMLGVSGFFQSYLFNLVGVSLTTELRSLAFSTIVQQEIRWFDEEDNSVGVLSARLSGDAASLRGAIGIPFSNLIQAGANVICCIILSFYFSWRLTLACLTLVPFLIASIFYEAKYTNNSVFVEKRIVEETSRIVIEALANIRTVAALRREPQLIVEYDKEVSNYQKQIKKRLRIRGFMNSSTWALLYVEYAVSVTYGAILCASNVLGIDAVIMVTESLLFGMAVFAMSLAFLPSFLTAVSSGERLFQLIDSKTEIHLESEADIKPSIAKPSEGVVYRDISFRYPSRPDVKVLNGLNLNILQGKTLALVGASGSGKSTCIQLLMRYYDPDQGYIKVEGQNIHREMTVSSLRSRIGIVSQEPVLFESTIAENIAYGDNSRTVPMSEIIEAAKMANAHSFITALPNGYETKLGARGTQLSGGQKQRIAIARAIVKNPRFLLLDEATSALDVQSEKIVQSALDVACSGRTCIVVAHRLTTIQNADLICVLQNGQVVEQGNHAQLLAVNGLYAELHRNQILNQ